MNMFRHISASTCLLLVALNGNARVAQAQDLRLRPVSSYYADAAGQAIANPEGVGAAGSLLVVADTGNQRLLRFELVDGQMAPTGEIRLAQLPYPTHVRVDSRGRILALDGRSQRVVSISPIGDFEGLVELAGVVDGDDLVIKSFETDRDNRLYLLDVAGSRVLVLEGDGTLERQISFGAEVGFLSDIAVGPSGAVFAIDSVTKRVLRAGPADEVFQTLPESLEEDVAFPTAIVADGRGSIFVADQSGGGIVVLGRNGAFQGRQSAMGWREGFLRYPSALAVNGDVLYVADRGNNRIQAFEIVR